MFGGKIQKVIVCICQQFYLVTYRSWPCPIFRCCKMIDHSILFIGSHFLSNYRVFIEKVYTGLCSTWSMQCIRKLQIVDEKYWKRKFKPREKYSHFLPFWTKISFAFQSQQNFNVSVITSMGSFGKSNILKWNLHNWNKVLYGYLPILLLLVLCIIILCNLGLRLFLRPCWLWDYYLFPNIWKKINTQMLVLSPILIESKFL